MPGYKRIWWQRGLWEKVTNTTSENTSLIGLCSQLLVQILFKIFFPILYIDSSALQWNQKGAQAGYDRTFSNL